MLLNLISFPPSGLDSTVTF
ncbi:hypothetical protein E2C01_036653 [Portunus trituberculatus]|uniref:Uncharacterized protein n=1 Tax=Portunus trituberculatus TaxID=210409 RepID=A0A5B7FD90_PORTR|nr:hypothetical protein [Portunus trituberculatus]